MIKLKKIIKEYEMGLNMDDSFSTLYRLWKTEGTSHLIELLSKLNELENPAVSKMLQSIADQVKKIEPPKERKNPFL